RRLALGLSDAVELAALEIVAADHGLHLAGGEVDRDQRPLGPGHIFLPAMLALAEGADPVAQGFFRRALQLEIDGGVDLQAGLVRVRAAVAFFEGLAALSAVRTTATT